MEAARRVDFRVYPLIFAPFIGSFLGVLILRLPEERPFAWQRSACPYCGARLAWWEMVPILSFLWLRGRCRHCGGRIDPLHLWVEMAALAVAGSAVAASEGAVARDPGWLWADCVLGWGLLALAWIDARTMLLPDVLTLPLLLLGLGATAWLAPGLVYEHALAAALGYASFVLVAAVYRRLRGFAGLGAGDAKLMGVAGAWLGLGLLPWVVLLAALLGLAGAGTRMMRGEALTRTSRAAFGPYLALAIWTLRLWGG